MLLKENITMAISAIFANKMRSLLTMLGIIIGIAAVIAIFTVGDSLSQSVTSSLQGMGSSDIFVSIDERETDNNASAIFDGVQFASSNKSTEMTDADYITSEMIHELAARYKDEIYAINVTNTLEDTATVSKSGKNSNVMIEGVSTGFFVTNDVDIVAGAMLSESDFVNGRMTCLVEQGLVDDIFDGDANSAVGQTIEVNANDTVVNMTIAGVYQNSSSSSYSSMMSAFMGSTTTIYLPLKAMPSITHEDGKYATIRVSAAADADTTTLKSEVEDFFYSYYRNNINYEATVYTYESIIAMLDTLLGSVTTAISLVAAIALVVGGIGVMNIMLVSVTERTREIGTRKALGAKNSSIRAQFIVEAMFLCLIGGIIGLLLGLVAGIALSNYMGYPAVPSLKGILISIGFSMAIGLFFGYFPANKAAKMNPIDALRYE